MKADLHTHTPLCHHATGSPAEFVASARQQNMGQLGISEHAPVAKTAIDDWRMEYRDIDTYWQRIASYRQYAASDITIHAGLEHDWLPGCEDWIKYLRKKYPWDYHIGAVHYLEQWNFDNPATIKQWQQASVNKIWQQYWQQYHAMIKSGLFDIYAHPDLVKKFNFKPPLAERINYYKATISLMKEMNGVFEINTAGWQKPCAEPYPESAFLELAAQANLAVCINSDAHKPVDVGYRWADAAQLLRDAGFQYYVVIDSVVSQPGQLVWRKIAL